MVRRLRWRARGGAEGRCLRGRTLGRQRRRLLHRIPPRSKVPAPGALTPSFMAQGELPFPLGDVD
eukprot:487686-Lingulodinium_polyedra.AAC.1